MRVLSFGEILLRLASPGYTKLFQKDSLNVTFCGAEANVAVSLSHLGLESNFLTKLPNGAIGQAAVDSMRCFDVNTNKIIYGDGRMGLYYFEKGVSQRPSKVIYDRVYSTFALADESDFEWDSLFEGIDWFHWSGINPALSGNMAVICLKACKAAKAKGITISCDLNYRKNLWTSKKAQSIMTKLMPYIDVCMANEEDAEKDLNIKLINSDVETGKLNKAGYEFVAKEISEKFGCRKVAVTLRESYNASVNGWSAILYNDEKKKCFIPQNMRFRLLRQWQGTEMTEVESNGSKK